MFPIVYLVVALGALIQGPRAQGAATLTVTFSPTNVTLSDGTASGAIVSTAAATGGTGVITYATSTSSFAIGASNGSITTSAALDFATKASHNVVVTATDNSTAKLSGTGTLVVTVTEANTKPSFANSSYSTTFCSTAKSGTVGTYKATDPDKTSPNNMLTYSIATGDDAKKKFSVKAGVITKTNEAFNKTAKASYTLVLQALDGGNTHLSATAAITVKLGECSSAPRTFSATITIATIAVFVLKCFI